MDYIITSRCCSIELPMDIERFEFLARKLRAKEPALSAARLVLVHSLSIAAVVQTKQISQPSLSRSVKSYRELDAEIQKYYGPPRKPKDS